MNNFGELYRRLRKGKEIQLKEAAEGIMSPQAVSKFERGDSNITVSNLLLLLDKINVSYEEFFELSNVESLSSIIKTFEVEMDWAAAENLYFEWQKLIKKYQRLWHQTKRSCYRHFQLLAEYYYAQMNNHTHRVSLREIIEFLLTADYWGKYELFIVNYVSFEISSDLLNVKIESIIRRTKNDLNTYQILDFFMVTAGVFFKRSEYDNFIKLVESVQLKMAPQKVVTNLFFLLFIDYIVPIK